MARSELVAPQTSLRVPRRALRGLMGVFSQRAVAFCLLHLIEEESLELGLLALLWYPN